MVEGAQANLQAIVMGEEPAWRPWGELLYSVQTGLPAFEHVFGMPLLAYLPQHPDVTHTYHADMAEGTALTAQAVVEAYDFSGIRMVVDVGGGQGALIAAILKAHPHMHGMLFDLPHSIPGAERVMETEALAERCPLIGGDFFAAAGLRLTHILLTPSPEWLSVSVIEGVCA